MCITGAVLCLGLRKSFDVVFQDRIGPDTQEIILPYISLRFFQGVFGDKTKTKPMSLLVRKIRIHPTKLVTRKAKILLLVRKICIQYLDNISYNSARLAWPILLIVLDSGINSMITIKPNSESWSRAYRQSTKGFWSDPDIIRWPFSLCWSMIPFDGRGGWNRSRYNASITTEHSIIFTKLGQ